MSELMEIDGSVLEGGGQILRISISLSAILGIPVRVSKIRAGRSKPGLAAQHLTGIKLVGEMCKARVTGATIGSTMIEFRPGKITGGHFLADTQTAGSVSLLLQVALPCALLADGPVTLELKGGTNADMAPQIDYMTRVFQHTLRKFGADFTLKIHRRGYFPKGGGHVTVNVNPIRRFRSVDITDRGTLCGIKGWSFVSGILPLTMANQMAEGAKQELPDVNNEIFLIQDRDVGTDNCNGILLVGETSSGCVLGSDGLGRRGAQAQGVGRAAANKLCYELHSGACLDSHAQDQVIIYMALADGTSVVSVGEVTLHTKTAIYIAEMMAKTKFNITSNGEQNLIECTGIGFTNRFIV